MKTLEILELAMHSLRYRSLRSWLAILGVVIGVASIISLISISTGLNDRISGQLGGLGANVITVSPGNIQAMHGGFGQFEGRGAEGARALTFLEADSLRRMAGVDKLDARLSHNAVVRYRTKNASLSVVGTEPQAFLQSANVVVEQGRSLQMGDGPVAVVGHSVMNETFGAELLNQPIQINGHPFRVVGVLNASGATFGGSDTTVYIPRKSAMQLFNQTQNATNIVIVAKNGSVDAVANETTQTLLRLHRVIPAKQDFRVVTAASLQSTLSGVTSTLGLFLGVIASLSLLVGGIGVANAMFTSVLEQTKYIGILKSLGTTRNDILKLFLFEACLVGLVGGILGVLISFLASFAMGRFNIPTRITPELILLGMAFSVGVGAVSGVLPARNAASVPPVEALRYE